MEEKEEKDIIVLKYKRGRDQLSAKEIDEWEDPQYEIYHVTDRYGFIHDNRLPEKLSDFENKIRAQENTRLSKWLKMLKSWEQYFPNSDKLRTRVYKGIPNAVRGEVWARLLNISRLKQEQDGKYNEMLEYGLDHSPDIRQIDLDVNRTYRNHIMFRERYNTKQQMLFKVLVAYSVYNSDAFWSLSALMSDDKHAMHDTLLRKGMEQLIEFLQIELEKDFGYRDDQAITALQQSVQDLRKHNMLSPREGPTQLELPSRPFGLILPPDRRNSFLNDNQSIAGSIILRPTDSVSLAQTSRTGSEVGSVSDFDNNEQSKLQRSISIYDNVDIHECIEAAKRLSAVDSPQHRPRSRESRTLSAHSQEVETHSQTDVKSDVKSDVKEITEKNERILLPDVCAVTLLCWLPKPIPHISNQTDNNSSQIKSSFIKQKSSSEESTKLRIFVPFSHSDQQNDNKIQLRVDSPTLQLKTTEAKRLPVVDT
ncbi:unnamed protein product [Oppiella nova]|uniref:Rab-GAP TBC domain-containing protein n=1 Tax=Oppiella nova TaxID=334625 RepID=A0A7R9QAI5_9ACAR|nr:unnamed protein product [Oppiella nova]CAG2161966.1 unnamed protein product [Oppiella nova]